MSGTDCDHFPVADMLSLEDGREHNQRFELGLSGHDHGRHAPFRVEAILSGSAHHTAAIKASLHGGCQPDRAVGFGVAVHADICQRAVIAKQQTLDGNGGIIDGLVRFQSLFVADFATIAVNAIPDAVEKIACHAIDRNGRQVLKVWIKQEGRVIPGAFCIAQEVVAAPGCEVIDVPCGRLAAHVVDKVVQRALAPGKYHGRLGGKRVQVRPDIGNGCYIDVVQ